MRYILLFIVLASFYIPSVASNQSVLNSTHPTCTKAWVGAAIAAGASLLGGLMANNSQRKGTKEQLRAQELENQRNREYNLMLAQQQNAWNVEQWERENEYNDPAAQMKRFKNAGLNPDLMAGSGAQNLSAPSPTMTAGAPSTPQDMSALGRRPSFGEAVQMALRDSMIGAQIDNIKADTERKRLDNDVQKELKDFLGLDFKDVEGVNDFMFSPQAQKYILELRQIKENIQSSKYENWNKSVDQVIRELNVDLEKKVSSEQWKALSEHFGKSVQECKEFIRDAALRLRGLEADVSNKEADALWNSPEILKDLPSGLPMIVKFLRQIIGK